MENKKMLENIRKELENIYNGKELNSDGEIKSFHDYICDDVLDMNYIVNSNKEYVAVELLITFGGPNVYINTRNHEIELYWGTDHETLWIPSEICEEIDSVCEEYYNC